MAMEKAVITEKSPAILEHFKDGDGICLITPGNGEELADKIVHLADHPQERKRLSGRAHQLVREQFDSRRIARMFLDLLDRNG